MTTPADEAAQAARRRAAIHHVSGTTIDCCEDGETDCPCVCHSDATGGEWPIQPRPSRNTP